MADTGPQIEAPGRLLASEARGAAQADELAADAAFNHQIGVLYLGYGFGVISWVVGDLP